MTRTTGAGHHHSDLPILRSRVARLSIMLGAAITLLMASESMGDTVHVPAQATTIQQAIELAAPGDEILVQPGVFHEQIDLLGKALTLRSAAGAEETIIDGEGLGGSVITCDSGETAATVIDGFTIRHGEGSLLGSQRVGGGMLNVNSSPTVRNCIFEANVLEAANFSTQASGAAMHNVGASPRVEDCVFRSNELLGCSGWLYGGAGMCNEDSSPQLERCLFQQNLANNGGGMMNLGGSHPTLISCRFEENDAAFSGGALNCTNGASAALINCTVVGNSAYQGGGLYATSADLQLVNSTVANNYAASAGGGVYIIIDAGESSLTNCILWGNGAGDVAMHQLGLYAASADVRHCDVQGSWPGEGNLNVHPQFVSPASGDYRLLATSPCIDAGDSAAVLPLASTDADGNARLVGAAVDLGERELQSSADSCLGDLVGGPDGGPDGVVEVFDLLALLGDWGLCAGGNCSTCGSDLNGDCMTDVFDLLQLMSMWGACGE